MLTTELMPERNCAKCTKQNKKEWGCDKDAPIPYLLDGEELRRCPLRPTLDDPEFYGHVFWSYNRTQQGFLLEEGSYLSQPGLLVECWKEIDRANSLLDRERHANQRKDAARAAKSTDRKAAQKGMNRQRM